MKHMKKYQYGDQVKGTKGGKASQIIAGISGAATAAAGIITEAMRRKRAKKAEEEKQKMEMENKKKGGAMKKLNKYQSTGEVKESTTVKKSDYATSADYLKAIDSLRQQGQTVNLPREKSPASWKKMKTGGMVNSNKKVSALTKAGSKGVKSGVNPKASASKVAKGRSGGTSTAPKGAVPKAKYGMVMRRK